MIKQSSLLCILLAIPALSFANRTFLASFRCPSRAGGLPPDLFCSLISYLSECRFWTANLRMSFLDTRRLSLWFHHHFSLHSGYLTVNWPRTVLRISKAPQEFTNLLWCTERWSPLRSYTRWIWPARLAPIFSERKDGKSTGLKAWCHGTGSFPTDLGPV